MHLYYRSFERTTPILFEKLLTKSVNDDFMREKKALFDKAGTSCLPSVIRMGRELTEKDLQQHVSFFREKLVGLPSRLPRIYSCYRFFTKEVSKTWFIEPNIIYLNASSYATLHSSGVSGIVRDTHIKITPKKIQNLKLAATRLRKYTVFVCVAVEHLRA